MQEEESARKEAKELEERHKAEEKARRDEERALLEQEENDAKALLPEAEVSRIVALSSRTRLLVHNGAKLVLTSSHLRDYQQLREKEVASEPAPVDDARMTKEQVRRVPRSLVFAPFSPTDYLSALLFTGC